MSSVHIEDDPVDKYSLSEQQQPYGLPEQQQQQDLETEIVVEETPLEETSSSFQSSVNVVHETTSAALEEPVGEPQKKTYASIVCVQIHILLEWCSIVCVYLCMYCLSVLCMPVFSCV